MTFFAYYVRRPWAGVPLHLWVMVGLGKEVHCADDLRARSGLHLLNAVANGQLLKCSASAGVVIDMMATEQQTALRHERVFTSNIMSTRAHRLVSRFFPANLILLPQLKYQVVSQDD
jgi:hypothetical protein